MEIKIEDFYKEGIEPPKCVRCGGVLKPNPEIDSDEEEGIYEFICPECGAIHTLSIPEDDDRKNYPYWNGDKSAESGHGYGYDAICPFCVDENGEHSHWMVWLADYKKSEYFGLSEGVDSSDGYYPEDDYESCVSSLTCLHCGVVLTVGNYIPKDYDKYPFWRKRKQESAETAEKTTTTYNHFNNGNHNIPHTVYHGDCSAVIFQKRNRMVGISTGHHSVIASCTCRGSDNEV